MASLSLGRFTSASRHVYQNGTTKRHFSAIFSMTDEFPDLPSTSPTSSNASSSSITILPTGLTVVTEDASTTSTVTITFPTAGSSSETNYEAGAALANKAITFKSGSGLSSALILRTLESDGASPFTTAGRSGATVGFTCAPDKAQRLIPLLATECTFQKWDVREAIATADTITKSAMMDVQTVLTEQIYAAAYGPQSALGKSFFTPSATKSGIISFREKNYGMNGAILSATGVSDHDAFVKSVSEGFSEANPGPSVTEKEVAAVYMGGESRIFDPSSGYTHVALGFESPGSSTALRNVMKYCLSLSSDGSGNVSGFTASGLVGLYASTSAPLASTLMDSISTVLTSSLSDELVARAKALAKAEAIFALDSGSKGLADAMSSSVVETGSFSSVEVAASYDDITKSKLSAAMIAALKSNPAVAAIGDVKDIPYQAAISARFS